MRIIILLISVFVYGACYQAEAQNITYSEIDKSDNRNIEFEIIGKFSENFLVYKNANRRHELTIYGNDMAIAQKVNLDFISDRVSNIDFISYPDHFIMIWQYEKGNVIFCKAANMSGTGKLIGNVTELDITKTGFFSNRTTYSVTRSEDKKKILLYKVQTKNDVYDFVSKIYDENLMILDSSKKNIDYNDRREDFGDMEIDNEGTLVFAKTRHNARVEFINALDIYSKRLKSDSLYVIKVPLNERLIGEPFIKIDNFNKRYLVNSLSYRKFSGNAEGIFIADINALTFKITKQATNVFNDSLRSKLSGRPDWRTAYDNFNLRNIILKKDGGFIIIAEEYYRQSRYGNSYDERFASVNPYRYNDYSLYNRDNYGNYRPLNGAGNNGIIYNYNDIISLSVTKDLRVEWNSVINKTTNDIENDNFLSFANMNAGGEIHFLFLQKDRNRQIISDHALQPDGAVTRYATLKGREAGYYFMPRLSRQTGLHQMLIPCIAGNNLAFAKIDF